MQTQRILVSVVLDAFDALAAKPRAFACPIEYLKLPRQDGPDTAAAGSRIECTVTP